MTVNSDTICSIATAPGGAIGIIRISGSKAFSIANTICTRSILDMKTGTFRHCQLKDGREILDDVIVSSYKAPHSYTGEDCVEISCHGSPYILRRTLTLLTEHGCRMATPGEYTQRAFLNGKMDLSQAEAVADLISAHSRAAHHAAISHLRGHFSEHLRALRDRLLHLTSLLELELDFSDHEDLTFADRSELLTLTDEIETHISRLAHSFKTGQAVKNGIPVCIVGETNVGKSTLLNQLIKEERAIVSHVHGTTRDTIEECIDIHGLTFRFIDTAGLRETDDQIEQIGIERTYEAIRKASIVIWVTDERPSNHQIEEMHELTVDKPLITVQNKADLLSHNAQKPWTCPMYFISAKHGHGIVELEEAIAEIAHIPDISTEDILVTNTRHYEALIQARQALLRARQAIQQNISAELVSEDLRATIQALSTIVGDISTQDVLNNIFSHFCVGK